MKPGQVTRMLDSAKIVGPYVPICSVATSPVIPNDGKMAFRPSPECRRYHNTPNFRRWIPNSIGSPLRKGPFLGFLLRNQHRDWRWAGNWNGHCTRPWSNTGRDRGLVPRLPCDSEGRRRTMGTMVEWRRNCLGVKRRSHFRHSGEVVQSVAESRAKEGTGFGISDWGLRLGDWAECRWLVAWL